MEAIALLLKHGASVHATMLVCAWLLTREPLRLLAQALSRRVWGVGCGWLWLAVIGCGWL